MQHSTLDWLEYYNDIFLKKIAYAILPQSLNTNWLLISHWLSNWVLKSLWLKRLKTGHVAV